MMNKIKFIAKWIWCLPQNLVAVILKKFIKIEQEEEFAKTRIVYCYLKGGSVSLGRYIFLTEGHWGDEFVYKHEYGHHRQSNILGPLYLLVIGLPSFIWCNVVYPLLSKFKPVDYYSFYTEKWANKLGGVE